MTPRYSDGAWRSATRREQDKFIDELIHDLARAFPGADEGPLFGLAQEYAAREGRTITLNEIAEALSREAGFDPASNLGPSSDASDGGPEGWQ